MLEETTPIGTHSKDPADRFLQEIKKQVNHARQTVNQLLEAAAQPEFQLFDLRLQIEVLLHETLQRIRIGSIKSHSLDSTKRSPTFMEMRISCG